MRMFAIEVFFQNSLAKVLFNSEDKYQFRSEDLERVTGLKNIFLTASPFLISEIKTQYNELKMHVKEEFKNREVEKNLLGKKGKTQNQEKGGLKKFEVHYGLDVIENAERQIR